jgi:hypothetical protein
MLGPRLRAIIDAHYEQGNPESAESISARRLSDSGAEVRRLHFGRQQHIKVLLVRRSGKPIRILTGSTDFSLRGFYIQAYNALLFNHDNVASLYGAVFDAYWRGCSCVSPNRPNPDRSRASVPITDREISRNAIVNFSLSDCFCT